MIWVLSSCSKNSEQIVLVDVGLVAEPDDRRDAHLGRAREADDGHADAAGLRRQRGLALDVVGGAEGRAQMTRRVVEAVDIGPHEPHAVLAPDLDQFVLPGDVAGLGESRRNQNGAGDFLLAHLDQRLRDEFRRNGEHRDVDLARHVLDALVGLLAHDGFGARVNRIDRALVAAVDQVLHDRIADLAVFGRGADHRHGLRLHDAVHLLDDQLLARAIARRRRLEVEHDAHVGRGRAALGRRTPDSNPFPRFPENPRPATTPARSCRRAPRDPPASRRARRAESPPPRCHPASTARLRCVAGASRKVMSFSTSTRMPPRPKATSLPNAGSVTAPMMTSWPPASICCTWTPRISALRIVLAGVVDDRCIGLFRLFRRLDADDDAARFGLVQDLRRDDLHDDRKADLRGELGRLVGASSPRLPSEWRFHRPRRRRAPRARSELRGRRPWPDREFFVRRSCRVASSTPAAPVAMHALRIK